MAHAGALTAQFLTGFVVLVIVAAEFGNVDHALNKEIFQLNEESETGHPRNRAGILLAEVVPHVIALQPCLHITRCLVSAPFIG